MFEVIICTVATGRVDRKHFNTWDEAQRYVANREAHYNSRRYTFRNRHRIEINRLPAQARKSAPVAASVAA